MLEESKIIIRNAVDGFVFVHQRGTREAYSLLISIFITCFSILSREDRVKCLETLVLMINDVEMEVFEDGSDFISFLKEKAVEWGYKEGEADGKNANNQQ